LQLSVLLVIPRSRGRFNIDSENIRNLSARAGRSRDREFGARCFYLVWHKAFKDSDYKGCNVSLSIASNEMPKKPARESARTGRIKDYPDFAEPPPPLAFVDSLGHAGSEFIIRRNPKWLLEARIRRRRTLQEFAKL